MSTEDTIQEFAPALRTSSQSEAFCIALHSPVSLHIISAYQTSVLSQDMRSLSSAQSGYSRAFGATDADSSSSRFLARLTVA